LNDKEDSFEKLLLWKPLNETMGIKKQGPNSGTREYSQNPQKLKRKLSVIKRHRGFFAEYH
jgi:hypothetical protein